MNELKFIFEAPEHGWMDVTVSDGSKEISLVVSDVPCNSLHKLANILLGLQSGAKSEEVEFSLEPDFALWKFHAKDEGLELYVYPNSIGGKPVLFSGEREKVIHRLYKAMRDLESLSCWKEPDAIGNIWSWEFPSKELTLFSTRAKSAKRAIK